MNPDPQGMNPDPQGMDPDPQGMNPDSQGMDLIVSCFPPRQSSSLHLPLITSLVPHYLHLVFMPVSPVAHSLGITGSTDTVPCYKEVTRSTAAEDVTALVHGFLSKDLPGGQSLVVFIQSSITDTPGGDFAQCTFLVVI
ncbi:hypothetical protein EYF80_038595 [Liparis tanakae]|uniref:Uncharacterized protein n=1 Tax=Liparis tanakae TaxID=230148 RepID=A0A4Z2GC91_9TELE|nr:hypothetical protein EYF80_038595 [Liparis tanakae]